MDKGSAVTLTLLLANLQAIRNVQKELDTEMATVQEQLDSLTTQVEAGIQQLYDAIDTLKANNPNVDFTQLQGVVDRLNNDAIGDSGDQPVINPL